MLTITFDVLICLLAAYGALSLAISIFNTACQRFISENTSMKIILMVKNQAETIEGVVRDIFTGDFSRKVMSGNKLTVVDMGSMDETVEILRKLKDDYEYLEVVTSEEKDKIFTYFDSVEVRNQNMPG